jgi:uncharacterized protein (DUF1684 family)
MIHTGKIRTAIIFLAVVFVLFAVVPVLSGQPDNGKNPHKQWRESLIEHRRQKDRDFKTSATSPMAGSVRLLVKPGRKAFIVRENRDFSVSRQEVPGTQLSLENRKSRWVWKKHADGITCTAGEKSIAPGSLLPEQCNFQVDQFLVKVYITKDGLVLLVFDPMRTEIQHFSHLYYFPPAPEFALPAVLKKFPKIEKVTMLTSQNLEKTFYRYAALHFKWGGKELQLTAFKFGLAGDGETGILFIPFADATSGKETYEVGRFLEIPEPKESNFILDFNYCFNPLCNYSPAYNCPIPPLENTLDVPIKAGEKTYPH